MKKYIHIGIPVICFIIQLYLIQHGVDIFGKYINPIIILLVSLAIPVRYFFVLLRKDVAFTNTETINYSLSKKILFLFIGFATIALCYKQVQFCIQTYIPAKGSDVIPQLEALYSRASQGIFPYAPVQFDSYAAYPVYMPFHWLPIGITKFYEVDVRWSGILLLAIAAAVYGLYIFKGAQPIGIKLVAVFLPSFALWSFIIPHASSGMPITLETIIAAYYLLLATGLLTRNLTLSVIGIILCLLSRYTLVFWLPLFLFFIWIKNKKTQNLAVWLSIILSVLLFYIIPFYLKDHTILSQGIHYHNDAAINEWKGYGNPPVSWTFESGINFAPHMHNLFHGDMAHRVFLARVVQAISMIFLLAAGYIMYKKWKDKINYYDISLVMLYCCVLFFYLFGPLTYRYYFLPLVMISAAIAGKTILTAQRNIRLIN